MGGEPVPLPAPWGDVEYSPLPLNYELEGPPGPDFCLFEKTDPTFETWHAATLSL